MTECPVCRSSVFGQPEQCKECGAPLRRSRERRSVLPTFVSFFLPGLRQAWKGNVIKGMLGLYGSFFLYLWLLVGSYEIFNFAWRLSIWGVIWVVWAPLWLWDAENSKEFYPTYGRIASVIVVSLMLANGLMILLLGLVFNRNVQL